MLQSMQSQRAGHDLETEQQQEIIFRMIFTVLLFIYYDTNVFLACLHPKNYPCLKKKTDGFKGIYSIIPICSRYSAYKGISS